jgi:hypothetical protein
MDTIIIDKLSFQRRKEEKHERTKWLYPASITTLQYFENFL